jgi:hypothetical protein
LRPVQRHDSGDETVDLLGRALLVQLQIPGGVGADDSVPGLPARDRVAAVAELPRLDQPK